MRGNGQALDLLGEIDGIGMGAPEYSDCIDGSALGYAVSFVRGVLHQQIWLHEYEIGRILCWARLLQRQHRLLVLAVLADLARLPRLP